MDRLSLGQSPLLMHSEETLMHAAMITSEDVVIQILRRKLMTYSKYYSTLDRQPAILCVFRLLHGPTWP